MLAKVKSWDLEIDDNGMIPTLNQMGHMFVQPDVVTNKFIQDATHCSGKVLDIGAAFGMASIPVILAGKSMDVNDLDVRHLNYIRSKLPQDKLDYFHPLLGHFPGEIKLKENSYEVIYASRILHFLPPTVLMSALHDIFCALQKKGRFYFISTTPYIYVYRDFISTYEQNKKRHKKWPGLMENLADYAPHRKHQLPKFINLLDMAEAQKHITSVGFHIQDSEYISAEKDQNDIYWDGREHIGIIAVKP